MGRHLHTLHVEVDARDRDGTREFGRRGRGGAGTGSGTGAGVAVEGAAGDAGASDWTVVEPAGCWASVQAVPVTPTRSKRRMRERRQPGRGVVTASVSPATGR